MDDPIIEELAEAAHEAWFAEKLRRMDAMSLPPSWPAENGEEQLVPWDVLSDSIREFDRIVVRAMLGVLERRGMLS